MTVRAGRWGVVPLVVAVLAAGCGDDEPETTQAQVSTMPAPADDTASGDAQTGASADGGDDAEETNGEDDQTAAPEPPASGRNRPSPEEIRDYAEQQQELNDQIRDAAEAAQGGDPEELERLREELAPSAEQRRQIRRWLRERCAEPDPPPICERLEERRSS